MALIRILRKLAPVHVTDVTLVTKILEHLKQFNPTVLKLTFTVKYEWNLTVFKIPFLWLKLRWISRTYSYNNHLFEYNVVVNRLFHHNHINRTRSKSVKLFHVSEKYSWYRMFHSKFYSKSVLKITLKFRIFCTFEYWISKYLNEFQCLK